MVCYELSIARPDQPNFGVFKGTPKTDQSFYRCDQRRVLTKSHWRAVDTTLRLWGRARSDLHRWRHVAGLAERTDTLRTTAILQGLHFPNFSGYPAWGTGGRFRLKSSLMLRMRCCSSDQVISGGFCPCEASCEAQTWRETLQGPLCERADLLWET